MSLDKKKIAESLLAKVESAKGIDKLINLMAALRDPEGGCPWDMQQSYQTILPFTIEEVYEVAEAIENRDFSSLKDELGDLLFQVVFYAQIATEEQRFEFNDIVDNICDKLIRRHPHVFSDQAYQSEKELTHAWESQKHQERVLKQSQAKVQSNIPTSVLDDIPKALPELKRAHKLQKRAAKLGFDWPEVSQVWDKVEEECVEVKQAAAGNDKQHLEEELGDLMFALVNLTRHYGVDADMALRKASLKFEKRFRLVESKANGSLDDFSLEQMEALWSEAKNELKSNH